MPETRAIAKRDYPGYFKKGDEVTVIPVLFEKDTLIHGEIYAKMKDDGTPFAFTGSWKPKQEQIDSGEFSLIHPAHYHRKGTYKECVIKLPDNRIVSGSILGYKKLEEVFEKI